MKTCNEEENEQIGTCDQCGKEDCVFLANDPFMEEIYNEITEEEWWCDECYQNGLDKI